MHDQPSFWEDISKLRVINNLTKALKNLGITNVFLVKENTRKGRQPSESYFSYKFISGSDNFICNSIRKISENEKICKKFCGDCIKKIKDAPVYKECPFGLAELVVPIAIEGETISWFQLIEIVKKETPFTGIVSKVDKINADLLKVENYFKTKPQFSEEKIEMIGSILKLMANECSIYYEEKIKRQQTEKEISKHSFQGIIYKNKKIDEIIGRVDKIAKSDSPVMIYGESGVGKELFANLIHKNSDRKNAKFLILNCSALVETLLEAELFGFERGAFTGSVKEKVGLFELADKGTVFLDEIGDMSPSLQVKILRLIQEGTFMRVGGTQTKTVDVRIIGATNRNLKEMIKQGRFREDLYFRLAVFELNIPPLRSRLEEVPLLSNHFIDKYQAKMKKKGIQIKEDAIELLQMHDWPGNIRELENEIERAVALTEDYGIIDQNLISERIKKEDAKIILGGSLKSMLNEFEGKVILQILKENKWKKKRVAGMLGITQQWLNKRIHSLELDRRKKR